MRKKRLSRDQVLEAAEGIVRTRGLGDCTTRNLARVLNVAVGTIYNYYASRDELLRDLFQMSWEKTIRRLGALSEDDDKSVRDSIAEGLRILHEDVKNRGGLGGELGGNSPRVLFSDIRREIIEIFISMQMKSGEPLTSEMEHKAVWLFAVFADEQFYQAEKRGDFLESAVRNWF